MADDPSEDGYIKSEDGEERSSSDSERPGRSTERKSRQQRPIPQPRRLVHKSHSLVQSSSRQPSQGQSGSRQSSKGKSRESKRDQSRASQSSQNAASDYESILKRMISEVYAHSTENPYALDSSHIGASFWSAQEKDAFFRALDTRGRDDTPGISRAIGTKSQYEVSMYLTLLQKGVADQQQASCTQTNDCPAALEISEQIEALLETLADRHAVKSYEHDLSADLAKYGDDFLIDEETADLEEILYKQQESTTDISEDALSSDADAYGSVSKPSPDTTAKSDQASLFRLSTLLQLMRNVFMNNGEQEHLNWHHIDPVLEDSSEPAIYKSALEDLATIVGNLTRRLVQVTIFQAMTRLRAGHSSRSDWTPIAAIREVDVHQAAALLDMKPDWHQYWADVVDRNCLAVYSDSKKYQDGRPGKKFGYRLTSKEVCKELFSELEETPEPSRHEMMDNFEDDVADLMEDGDLLTEDEINSDRVLGATNDSDSEVGSSRPGLRKRKRALSPRAFARAEDRYLEAMDQHNSMQEEVRLWRSLSLDPPQELLDRKPHDLEAPCARLEPSKAKSWRDTIDYCDDWELGFGVPKESEFLDMDREGCRGRKRRKAITAVIKARLGTEPQPVSACGDDENEHDNSSSSESQRTNEHMRQGPDVGSEVKSAEDESDDENRASESTSDSSE